MIQPNFMKKTVSVKLLVIVIINFKRYQGTYCLIHVLFVATFKIGKISTSKLESQPILS